MGNLSVTPDDAVVKNNNTTLPANQTVKKEDEETKETIVLTSGEEDNNTDKFVLSNPETQQTQMSDPSSCFNTTYYKLQKTRARSINSINPGSSNKYYQVGQLASEMNDDENNQNNEALFDVVNKGKHLNFTSNNLWEMTIGNGGNMGWSTNNSLNFTYGTEKSNTLLNVIVNYGHSNATNSSYNNDDEDFIPLDDNDDKKETSTLIEEDDKSEDENDESQTKQHTSKIHNEQNYNLTLKHNRDFSLKIGKKERKYVFGIGTDFHIQNTGQTIQGILRGGVVDKDTGFGFTADITRSWYKTSEGWEKGIDTRCDVILLSNKKEDIVQTEQSKNEDSSSDTSNNNEETDQNNFDNLPKIKARNKFGCSLVLNNDELGAKGTYLIIDKGQFYKTDAYSRSQLAFNGRITNTMEDDKDGLKLKGSLEYNYKNVHNNGNYLNLSTELGYEQWWQEEERACKLIFGKLTFEGRHNNHKYGTYAKYYRTNNTSYMSVESTYNYDKNNWSLGLNAGFTMEGDMNNGENTYYLTGGAKVAYNF